MDECVNRQAAVQTWSAGVWVGIDAFSSRRRRHTAV